MERIIVSFPPAGKKEFLYIRQLLENLSKSKVNSFNQVYSRLADIRKIMTEHPWIIIEHYLQVGVEEQGQKHLPGQIKSLPMTTTIHFRTAELSSLLPQSPGEMFQTPCLFLRVKLVKDPRSLFLVWHPPTSQCMTWVKWSLVQGQNWCLVTPKLSLHRLPIQSQIPFTWQCSEETRRYLKGIL